MKTFHTQANRRLWLWTEQQHLRRVAADHKSAVRIELTTGGANGDGRDRTPPAATLPEADGPMAERTRCGQEATPDLAAVSSNSLPRNTIRAHLTPRPAHHGIRAE